MSETGSYSFLPSRKESIPMWFKIGFYTVVNDTRYDKAHGTRATSAINTVAYCIFHQVKPQFQPSPTAW